jgi:hypothetical protein
MRQHQQVDHREAGADLAEVRREAQQCKTEDKT